MEHSTDIEAKPSGHEEAEVMSADKAVNTLPPEDPIDAEAERKLKWKIDLLILPLLTGFYFFQSMGGADVGFASIAGLNAELQLTPQEFSNIVNLFLVGYIIAQLPGTLFLRLIGPSRQLGTACVMWGVFTILQVVVQNYAGLAGLRFVIGLCEGFGQGAVFYLSFWYTYPELATRGGIFWGSTSLASAFNGLVSYGIQTDLNGKNGWRPWRWIFCIEGIMPIVFGLLLFVFLPSTPETARFGFTQADKELAVKRSRRAHNPEDAKLRPQKILTVLLNPIFWFFTLIFSAYHYCNAPMTNFIPNIVQDMGFVTSVNAQLMSTVVFVCAFVGVLFFSRIADKSGQRAIILLVTLIFQMVGYIMLLGSSDSKVRFTGACILAFGNYPGAVLIVTWMAMCVVGYTRRGSTLALINMVGQAVSIAGVASYIDPPLYRNGNLGSVGMTFVEIVATLGLYFYLRYRNRLKDRDTDTPEAQKQRLTSLDVIGDAHPDFRFTL